MSLRKNIGIWLLLLLLCFPVVTHAYLSPDDVFGDGDPYADLPSPFSGGGTSSSDPYGDPPPPPPPPAPPIVMPPPPPPGRPTAIPPRQTVVIEVTPARTNDVVWDGAATDTQDDQQPQLPTVYIPATPADGEVLHGGAPKMTSSGPETAAAMVSALISIGGTCVYLRKRLGA